ncbi:MAG: carboxylate-amine ligase, partial [Planctomycetes bacterium]|nr:carboxylate-amine ligase [Planctomycetota bacterium]
MTTIASPGTARDLEAERTRFRRLQGRLRRIWDATHSIRPWAHSAVIVPSLSMDQDELDKIEGVSFYEERLLFSLIRLRNPEARVLYLTSQPVHPEIIDYYLQLLVGVPASHARRRLALICVYDASARPLTQKILERPRVLARIRAWIGNPRRAYMSCFNSTALERQLSVELGIPLNAVDPDLLALGTKSGCREVFAEAGADHPRGYENLMSAEQVARKLIELRDQLPELRRAVVKLNASFSGEGNALFTYPSDPRELAALWNGDLEVLRRNLEWSTQDLTFDRYFGKFAQIGGIVEEFVEAVRVESPSAQLRVTPAGDVQLLSTHDQVLGGATGQSYMGCHFPARAEYRGLIQSEALRIGRTLARKGATGRFAIDFVVLRTDKDAPWRCVAIEVNLRMGGTTFPFVALQFLTGGNLDPETGRFYSQRGAEKFYFATDAL